MTSKAVPETEIAIAPSNIVCTLKDGRVITEIGEDDIETDVYFQFTDMLTKNKNSPNTAMRWMMIRMFLLDGQQLTIDNLTEKPPVGVGIRASNAMTMKINELITGDMPTPKN